MDGLDEAPVPGGPELATGIDSLIGSLPSTIRYFSPLGVANKIPATIAATTRPAATPANPAPIASPAEACVWDGEVDFVVADFWPARTGRPGCAPFCTGDPPGEVVGRVMGRGVGIGRIVEGAAAKSLPNPNGSSSDAVVEAELCEAGLAEASGGGTRKTFWHFGQRTCLPA